MNNTVPGARCAVCNSKRRHDAESFVHQGMSFSQAARAVGVNRQALARHMEKHAAPLAEDTPPAPLDGPADVVFDAIGSQLETMLAGRLSQTARLQVLAEQRRLAESRARVVGPPLAATVTVNDVEGLPELFSALERAIHAFGAKHPELLAELRESIRSAIAATRAPA